MNEKAEMITQATILKIGWSKSMITKHLPDLILKSNLHYRSAALMKIWNKQDVINAMQMEIVKLEVEKASKRKISSKSAVEIKRLNLTENME